MFDRAAVEKENQDTRKQLTKVEKEVKQLRDWINSNERSLSGMPETLRRITEEGISRARADLSLRENDLQRLRGALAQGEKILARINDIDHKRREVANLEQEQERIIVLLERHRAELSQMELEFEELTRPVQAAVMPCEVVLPNNQRIALDPGKGEYSVGWYDATANVLPDIDLHPVGGSTMGVSRQHAILRFDQGQWAITDLGSTNGTFLNEAPLAPNQATLLKDKTRIRLGSVTIFFRHVTKTTRLQ